MLQGLNSNPMNIFKCSFSFTKWAKLGRFLPTWTDWGRRSVWGQVKLHSEFKASLSNIVGQGVKQPSKNSNPMLLKHYSYLFDDNCVVNWTASKAHITRTKGIKICLKEQQIMSLVMKAFKTNVISAYRKVSISQVTSLCSSEE
jgi:hypothetical protein